MEENLTERQQELLRDLKSWATLQTIITKLDDEHEVQWLMAAEQRGQNRTRLIARLYSRYCVLRKERELRELGANILP